MITVTEHKSYSHEVTCDFCATYDFKNINEAKIPVERNDKKENNDETGN